MARGILLGLLVGGFLGWRLTSVVAAPHERIWAECTRGPHPEEQGKVSLVQDCYERHMRGLTEERGVPEALAILVKVGERLAAGDCHLGAHFVGWQALHDFGTPARAFQEYRWETACSAGYTHGVVEEYLKERPDEPLAAVAKTVCEAPPGSPTAAPGGQWQCTHGFGHVVMAFTNYDLPTSIAVCDEFPDDNRRYGCGYGVFMENILAGHFRKEVTSPWVKGEDPFFPCNAPEVPERYFLSCYEWAPALITRYTTQHAPDALALCTSQANELARRGCLMGMGREMGTKLNATPEEIARWCTGIPENDQQLCLQKTMENYVNTPDRLTRGVALCNAVPTRLNDPCSWQFGTRVGWLARDQRQKQMWCDQLMASRPVCYQTAGLPPPR